MKIKTIDVIGLGAISLTGFAWYAIAGHGYGLLVGLVALVIALIITN